MYEKNAIHYKLFILHSAHFESTDPATGESVYRDGNAKGGVIKASAGHKVAYTDSLHLMPHKKMNVQRETGQGACDEEETFSTRSTTHLML